MATAEEVEEKNILDDIVDVASLEDEDEQSVLAGKGEVEENEEPIEPLITDTSWPQFVMKHFDPSELDEENHPKVAGLRRVGRLLLGPILKSGIVSYTPPKTDTKIADQRVYDPTVVVYEIVILWSKDIPDGHAAYQVSYSDIADVYSGNTDAEYCRFASSTAATRAEARCWRKALLLNNIVSAEEVTKVPLQDSGTTGFITSSQINFLDSICSRCDIDVMKYINCGNKTKYKTIEDIPFKEAQLMIEFLSKVQNGVKIAPDGISGYKKNWKKGSK